MERKRHRLGGLLRGALEDAGVRRQTKAEQLENARRAKVLKRQNALTAKAAEVEAEPEPQALVPMSRQAEVPQWPCRCCDPWPMVGFTAATRSPCNASFAMRRRSSCGVVRRHAAYAIEVA